MQLHPNKELMPSPKEEGQMKDLQLVKMRVLLSHKRLYYLQR